MSTIPQHHQSHDNQILSQLRQTIDNLNKIITNLRDDLHTVRQQLTQSHHQNSLLQQQLLQLTQSQPPLPSSAISHPIPPVIDAASTHSSTSPPTVLESNFPLPTTTLPDLPTMSIQQPNPHEQMLQAFLTAQTNLMNNQEKLTSHIMSTNKKDKKPPSST